MNWDQIEGNWKQAMAEVKQKWAQLTDDDILLIRGKRDQLIAKIQERYEIAKEAAEEQVDQFIRAYKAAKTRTREKIRSAVR
jgi:uncharacterized protein YjbJ (UPF0337 family)